LQKQVVKTNGISLSFTSASKNFLAQKGWDPQYGARPIDRAFNDYLLPPLTKAIISKELEKGDKIQVEMEDEKVVFQKIV
jgi:ATP-dependent Clp protease ATP-binding subunit ClpA